LRSSTKLFLLEVAVDDAADEWTRFKVGPLDDTSVDFVSRFSFGDLDLLLLLTKS
jgi:hypothetical protein